MKFVLASKNKHKAEEIRKILGEDYKIITQTDAGFEGDVIEDGLTFRENAIKKAETVMMATGHPTIADDSGLSVDALGGAPGVYTARFAGEGATDDENIARLLYELSEVPEEERSAQFICCIAFAAPNRETVTFEGRCEGKILFEKTGENGFGYDPVFFTPVFGKSLAEVSADEKNSISHRFKALSLFKESILGMF